MKIQQVTGQNPHKVIGTGTLLESARLIRYVAELLDLSDKSVQISVVGEHGLSAVGLLSSVRVMGLSLEEYLKTVTDVSLVPNLEIFQNAFKREAYRIFQGKGYTSTGVSSAACRIISSIASDTREVLPVSSVLQGEYGVKGIAVSVPSIIGRNGIEDIHEVMMTEEERDAFMKSVNIIRQAAEPEGLV